MKVSPEFMKQIEQLTESIMKRQTQTERFKYEHQLRLQSLGDPVSKIC